MTETKKILLIEDDPTIQAIVKRILTKEGFEVAIACDAMQGPMMARKNPPHLIILDLMMPAGGGASVLTCLRQMANLRSIPVLIYSARPREEIILEIPEDGFTKVLRKPASPAELLAAVKSLLAA